MGQQQILLIVLAIIIVGIALAVGLTMFSAQSVNTNRDAIVTDLMDLAAQAHQYKIRPSILGGGNGSYVGYAIPIVLQSNENGTYSVISTAAAQVTLSGTSAQGYGDVQATFDAGGRMLGTPSFTGQFN